MVPRDLALRIEQLIDAKVESYTPVAGGYSRAMRLLCHTATASFFAKIGATPLTSQFLRRERHIYNRVSGTFMPKLVAWEDHASAPILVIENLSAAQGPKCGLASSGNRGCPGILCNVPCHQMPLGGP